MGTAIQTTALCRHFGATAAVDGVDLDVADGEIYAFLGPNGAGKTTTVRILTTLLRPTSGSAQVAGHDVVAAAPTVRRLIGVALQQVAIDPLMTPRELLELQGALYRLSRAETARRSAELLDRLDLAESAGKRVMALSGGMRRRLDLAMALIGRPQVLFLDEPTTGLDPISRRAVWAEVRRLNDDGTTVFLTTQYLEEADQLADRVGFINRGRIALEGTPDTLKRQMGQTRLKLRVDSAGRDAAIRAVAAFGDLQRDGGDWLVVALRDGAAAVPAAMRALHEASVAVGDVDIQQPTLDDVFVSLTGEHAIAGGGPRAGAKA